MPIRHFLCALQTLHCPSVTSCASYRPYTAHQTLPVHPTDPTLPIRHFLCALQTQHCPSVTSCVPYRPNTAQTLPVHHTDPTLPISHFLCIIQSLHCPSATFCKSYRPYTAHQTHTQIQHFLSSTLIKAANPWLKLEQNLSKNTSIADFPFLPQSMKKLNDCKNITISSTLTAWWKTIKITKSSLAPCRLTPIWHNPDYKQHKTPIHFPTWQQKGITHLHHLFENNQFMSLSGLIQKYGLGRDQFLHY